MAKHLAQLSEVQLSAGEALSVVCLVALTHLGRWGDMGLA